MRFFSILLVGLFFFSFTYYSKSAHADRDLIDLIPGLYGGDGIQLMSTIDPDNENIPEHQPHFQADALNQLSQLTTGASEISFPIPSSQGGFTFEFDPVLNEFTRSTDSLGPIFAERPQTVGKNKINLGFSYTFIDFTRFDRDDLDSLSVSLNHEDDDPPGLDDPNADPPGPLGPYFYERDNVIIDLDVELKSHIFSFYGTYGITDKLDVGFLVPVIRNELDVSAIARVKEHSSSSTVPFDVHTFDPDGIDGDAPYDSADEEETGIGDIILRAKYFVLDKPRIKIAPALEIRLPTGDEDELMGLNRLGFKPLLILSSSMPVWGGVLSPHLNIGYEINAGAKGQDEIDYTVGFDYGRELYGDLVTLAVDVIGSHETQKRDDVGDDIIDISVGVKWNFYKQNLVYANAILPLNDQGLRADVITSAGYEIALR